VHDLYEPLSRHPRIQRVVALSGGYSRQEACRLLAKCHGMIASFSRALIDDLRASMSDAAFDAALGEAIEEIYQASVHKT
jgi:fructose-bisphosphate aldolase class I